MGLHTPNTKECEVVRWEPTTLLPLRELPEGRDQLLVLADIKFSRGDGKWDIEVTLPGPREARHGWEGEHRKAMVQDSTGYHPARRALLRLQEEGGKPACTSARWSAGGGIPVLDTGNGPWIVTFLRGHNAPNYPLHLTGATGVSEPTKPGAKAHSEDWENPKRIVISEVAEELLLLSHDRGRWYYPRAVNLDENANTSASMKAFQKQNHWHRDRGGGAMGFPPPSDSRPAERWDCDVLGLGEDNLTISRDGQKHSFPGVLLVVDAGEAAVDVIDAVVIHVAKGSTLGYHFVPLYGDSIGPAPIAAPIDDPVLLFRPHEFAKLWQPGEHAIARVFVTGVDMGTHLLPGPPRLTPVLEQGGKALLAMAMKGKIPCIPADTVPATHWRNQGIPDTKRVSIYREHLGVTR